jgi:hypothetical protein
MKSKTQMLKEVVEKEVKLFIEGEPGLECMSRIADFVQACKSSKEFVIKKEYKSIMNE